MVQRDVLTLAALDREVMMRPVHRAPPRAPIDLADATLVALAEARDLSSIFLDHDFAPFV
jgi:predicted nucleic acid-binding protein